MLKRALTGGVGNLDEPVPVPRKRQTLFLKLDIAQLLSLTRCLLCCDALALAWISSFDSFDIVVIADAVLEQHCSHTVRKDNGGAPVQRRWEHGYDANDECRCDRTRHGNTGAIPASSTTMRERETLWQRGNRSIVVHFNFNLMRAKASNWTN